MAQDLTDALKESLRQLGSEFKPNQLAYLSLTSKNEGPLCGALAWSLHKGVAQEQELTIRREYRNPELPRHPIDIAVLGDDRAEMLIEAKAAMAFDPLVKGSRVYPSKDVAADANKLRKVDAADRRYVIAFFTIYDGLPHCKHHAAITYIEGMKRRPNAQDRFEREGLPSFREAVSRLDPSVERIDDGRIPAGKAFGIKVSVWYELMAVWNR
ncbi:MAG: hypothetical protein F4149_09660 [Gammaproteobacteria bacterium]|nr:hypothetical protein [Gammaproteobacteria bacterium]MYK82903.1 hypothetical protein [Gammaproteobacteria bacterium]